MLLAVKLYQEETELIWNWCSTDMSMTVSGLSTTAVSSETPPSSAEAADANPEMLIIAMERVMVLFDRSVC